MKGMRRPNEKELFALTGPLLAKEELLPEYINDLLVKNPIANYDVPLSFPPFFPVFSVYSTHPS